MITDYHFDSKINSYDEDPIEKRTPDEKYIL